MPLTEPASFKARVPRYNRIQIPVLIKWERKLESDQTLEVELHFSRRGFYRSETFYARMSKDGRLAIPKLTVQELSGGGSLEGEVLKVTLYP